MSLVGIVAMITRKVLTDPNNITEDLHNFAINVPDLEKVKEVANRNVRKLSYRTLVATLRTYLITLNFLKGRYQVLKNKINKLNKKVNPSSAVSTPKTREANKFLVMISDYKKKIKNIKRKIEEEEGLN